MDLTPTILMVEDDPLVPRTVRRLLSPAIDIHHVATKAAGLRALRERAFDGALIDLGLGGQRFAGFEIVDALSPQLPCVVVTGSRDWPAAHAQYARRAKFLYKPVSPDELTPFVARVLCARFGKIALADLVAEKSALWRLPPMQRAVLEAVVSGESLELFAARHGISPKTAKRHLIAVLHRAEADDRKVLANALLREALSLSLSLYSELRRRALRRVLSGVGFRAQ